MKWWVDSGWPAEQYLVPDWQIYVNISQNSSPKSQTRLPLIAKSAVFRAQHAMRTRHRWSAFTRLRAFGSSGNAAQ